MEGKVFQKTGELIPLSEQNLLDCATDFNPAGCHGGGNVEQGLKYIVDSGGIQSESSYPYEAKVKRSRGCYLNFCNTQHAARISALDSDSQPPKRGLNIFLRFRKQLSWGNFLNFIS